MMVLIFLIIAAIFFYKEINKVNDGVKYFDQNPIKEQSPEKLNVVWNKFYDM